MPRAFTLIVLMSDYAPGFCWDQLCVIQLLGPRWCLACLCCSVHIPRVLTGSFAWQVRRGECIVCVVSAHGSCDVKPTLKSFQELEFCQFQRSLLILVLQYLDIETAKFLVSCYSAVSPRSILACNIEQYSHACSQTDLFFRCINTKYAGKSAIVLCIILTVTLCAKILYLQMDQNRHKTKFLIYTTANIKQFKII